MDILYSIFGILIGFTVHEYAHAMVADRLGDKTPRFQGRLTLNPIAHIDIVGFIMILIAGIGWAKPVQVNPRAFKNPKRDDLLVSLAGPLANLITAFIFAFLYEVILIYCGTNVNVNLSLISVIINIIGSTVMINCMLFVLNLIPLPGFDGFHIISDIFPRAFYKFSDVIYRYQMIIFIVFILLLGYYLVTIPSIGIANILIKFWIKVL